MEELPIGEGRPRTIDEILIRVREELGPVEEGSSLEKDKPLRFRRGESLTFIPMVSEPETSGLIPLGLPSYNIEDFSALDDEAFLQNAYRVVLGRDMDSVGRGYYLPALRSGHIGVVRVLDALRRSREGRAHGAKIRWIVPAAIVDRLSGLPLVGRFFAPLMQFIVRPTTNRRLATLSIRHLELISSVNTALSALRKNMAQLEKDSAQTEVRVQAAERLASTAQAETHAALDFATNGLTEIRSMRGLIVDENRRLGHFLELARTALPPEAQRVETDALDEHVLDSLYVAFENRFRGSRSEISRRSLRYLPIFRNNRAVAGGGVVLDIGCGRGEWLSLLRDNNILARGVDLNVAMVANARALGHEVVEGDAIAYLRGLQDASLAAVTGFHIVEHLPFKVLVALLDEARRCLMPGGLILFETPNPENLVVGACTFNYDPTHQKPLPPDLLLFLAEARSYAAARVIRSDADCDLLKPESGFKPVDVNDWFLQPPDYAVYAEKPAEPGQE